jgi:hypothetical protein
MVYIAFFDTGDWLRSARADREEPVIFVPAPVGDQASPTVTVPAK